MLRQQLLARRAAVPDKATCAKSAAALFLRHIVLTPQDVVAGYIPIRAEIDPLPLMRSLGNQLCLPVVVDRDAPLDFHVWCVGEPLRQGVFSTMVPTRGCISVPDIIIVPLVGWDQTGARLGYGGGFYDRTLAKLRALKPVRAIGYGFDTQGVQDHLPFESTDARLDALITETRYLEFIS